MEPTPDRAEQENVFASVARKLWKIGNDGLIAESKGHFDRAEYERQLKG